jgi:hypothetical protein
VQYGLFLREIGEYYNCPNPIANHYATNYYSNHISGPKDLKYKQLRFFFSTFDLFFSNTPRV